MDAFSALTAAFPLGRREKERERDVKREREKRERNDCADRKRNTVSGRAFSKEYEVARGNKTSSFVKKEG